MADFDPAFEIMIRNEGGFRLTDIPGDRGGQTYAGIARNFHSAWPGWAHIDAGRLDSPDLSKQVRDFYKTQFWDRVSGDAIREQKIAEAIFDFAVNAGVGTSAKLAQLAVDVVPDGRIGAKTLEKLNAQNPAAFVLEFAVLKMARYAEICNRDRTQSKFLLGWLNRTIKGAV